MTNTIQLDANNVGSFLGPIASKYSYTPSLRKRLDEVFASACRSTNKAFVLNGETVIAAQSTIDGAAQYMTDDTVLVSVELPEPTPEQLSTIKTVGEAEMLDIRDIQSGQEYFVITSDERGGRCVMEGMFIAAWETRKDAKEHAATLGAGFHVVKTVKP